MSSIAIILPAREGFSPDAFGAVSLSVKDFTLHSRYRNQCVVLGASTAAPFPGIRYEALPMTRYWWENHTRAYVRAIVARIKTLQPALIEVHNRPVLARALARYTHIPIALHLHNDPQEMKAAKTPAARARLLKECAAIYCISHWARERFLEGLKHGGDQVHTTHSGIDIPLPPQEKKKQIVFVGRMTPNKGGFEFAQALAAILPQHPDWHGYMIGGRRHSVSVKLSAYEKQILSVMDSIGPNVHFEGFYPHAQTLQMFRESDIVVIPSLWEEPFGRTGIEAIAQGCAVITSGRGGLKEIVADAGIMVNDVTGETIAQAIEALIASPERMREVQQKAYTQAQQFEISRCTETLDAIRDRILA
jgi:UDP-glucose:(glucosyl)LPS alpha-1,2-glucosyltransferase